MADLTERPVIGVTVGDPAGIGPEVVIKALGEPTLYNEVKPLVFADRSVLEQTVKMLGVDMDLHATNNPRDGHYEVGCIDFIDVGVLSERGAGTRAIGNESMRCHQTTPLQKN